MMKKSRPEWKRERQERWFNRAADALVINWPAYQHGYVCPLCLRWFPLSSLDSSTPQKQRLTDEHVPPDWYGGLKMILTCFECNSNAGTKLDNQARIRETHLDFLTGTMAKAADVRLILNGNWMSATLQRTGDTMMLMGLPRNSPPGATQKITGAIQAAIEMTGKPTGDVVFEDKYEHNAASVSFLRAAYLTAFAIFGYRYILSEPLAPVREQLATPGRGLLRVFSAIDNASPKDLRRIVLVNEPAELRSLVVQIGRHVVFLPRPEPDTNLYERLTWVMPSDRTLQVSYRGKEISWPREPQHLLDFEWPLRRSWRPWPRILIVPDRWPRSAQT